MLITKLEKIKAGDTIEIHLNDKKVINGIVVSNGIVSLNRFYEQKYNEPYTSLEDIYEHAMIFKSSEFGDSPYYTFTLEGPKYQLFDWKFLDFKDGLYKTIFSTEKPKFFEYSTILIEHK